MAATEVRYQPGSLTELLNSAEMHTFMAEQGAAAASGAGLTSATVVAFGRWCVNITNNAADAIAQEYGGRRGTTPTQPLTRILDQLWAADPNRHQTGRGLLQ
jgi:hypothetical protein